jgi:predicted HTH transcriptional regulator
LLKFDAYTTSALIADKVQKSIRTVERRIKHLKESGIVNRVGAKKSGKWLVNINK